MSYSCYLSKKILVVFGVFLLLMVGCGGNPVGYDLEVSGLKVGYTRQFGTPMNDSTAGVATDLNGNVYVAVNVARDLSQSTSVDQGILYKYDANGNFIETRRPEGVPCCGYWFTYIKGITGDKNGNMYVTGDFTDYTRKPGYGYIDKYDSSGVLVWTRKFSDTRVSYLGDPPHVRTNAISTDARGNVYVMVERSLWPYQTTDVSIRKHGPRGGFLWEKPIANVSTYAFKAILTTDAAGNIYTALASVNNYRETNGLISKWDSQGNLLWSQSVNPVTPPYMRTNVYGMVAVQGSVYITGTTTGNLGSPNLGSLDAFIRKYDVSGNSIWTRQFGTTSADWANNIAADALGNIYVTGSTLGNLLTTNKGDYDVFIRQYDSNGNPLQGRQFGTARFDRGDKVTLDANKNVYIAGATSGNMQGGNKGGLDIYLRKYIP